MENTHSDDQSKIATEHSTPVDNLDFNKLNFHGNAKAFFNIWVVNTLLTILTLGVYSAWAKVRTNRYIYSNTELDGHRFSYLAQPIQILKGRIVAALLIGLYFLLSSISPFGAIFLGLVVLSLTPILVVLGMRFNMRMTAYRNVRFGFKGRFARAFKVYALFPLLSIFTLNLAFPWVLKKMDEFKFTHITFGQKQFEGEIETSIYYLATFMGAFVALPVLVLLGLLSAISGNAGTSVLGESFTLISVFLFLLYIVVILVSNTAFQVVVRNHVFSRVTLPEVAHMHSDISFSGLVTLKLTNFLAIICSLGLAIPWAKIRSVKYFAEHTLVATLPNADEVLEQFQDDTNAIAEEAADLLDIDLSLG
ncbi:YjgN family protein [Alteromonas sp. a30]|uniref:YjgN family protein n=1 Tax=Alteromonas sp. a30 TaxID=2730917 RepID=UPI0022814E34|nr:YjgN family protein [Alteromonas sp. a30]MCY7297373.1 DUF898 domain-containing protein [Alteromonas sp. a30]